MATEPDTPDTSFVGVDSLHPVCALVHWAAWLELREEFWMQEDGISISVEGCIDAGYCIDQYFKDMEI